MSVNISIHAVELKIQTVKLTKALFKQFRVIDFPEIQKFLKGDGNEDPNAVIGWVHGSVLGDEWKSWLILRIGEGQYARYDAMDSTCKKYTQIYLA